MIHTSPTSDEYAQIMKEKFPPSLPVDETRYIDFSDAKGNYEKIVYPDFFRLNLTNSDDFSYSGALAQVKSYLDAKSDEVNKIITD